MILQGTPVSLSNYLLGLADTPVSTSADPFYQHGQLMSAEGGSSPRGSSDFSPTRKGRRRADAESRVCRNPAFASRDTLPRSGHHRTRTRKCPCTDHPRREGNDTVPACVRMPLMPLMPLVRQLHTVDGEVDQSDRTIQAITKANERARHLMTVPGIGPITASAIAASVQDVSVFSGPREFAAFLGLTPRQNASGGEKRLSSVSKMGDRYLRKLLVVGAHAVLYHRRAHKDALRMWANRLMESKPFKIVAVAVANKLARIDFAILSGGTRYALTLRASSSRTKLRIEIKGDHEVM